MKSLQRYGFLLVISFFMGRIWLFQINPFGTAFFAALCAERKGKKAAAFAVLLGMFTSMQGIALLKYSILFSLLIFMDYLQIKVQKKWWTPLVTAVLCGGLNMALGLAISFVSVNTWETFWMSMLESLAIVALANIFQWGIRFFLYEEWTKELKNEELISVLAIVIMALYGIPTQVDAIISISGTIGYLLVLFMGFRYGAATGAMTGAAVGVLTTLQGKDMTLVGIYCLLGVSVGMFRTVGRICSAVAFVVMGGIMIIVAQNQVVGIVELRAIVSAIIIFFALPKKIVHMVEKDKKEESNLLEKEDLRVLANNRMEDFSNAFRRLSKSFAPEESRNSAVSAEELERIYEEISERICSGCINCKFCWGSQYEDTSANIHRILWQAGEEGAVTAEVVTPEFYSRCVRLPDYMEKAEEKMAVARMNMGWKNRLTENREIIARQMMEIAGALKSFTLDLEDIGETAPEEKQAVKEELKKAGVTVKQLSVCRRKERLEIAFTGKCTGHRCLTKTDIAQILSFATDVPICPGRGTRNVLSAQEETMYFCQDTKWKALTGVARVAKAEETVSGDNYSFLELTTGELLMILADGMGSGEQAYQDSGNLIEVLEHLMEAGFEKRSALRLLNTLLVANYEGKTFTTLDMVSINLHTGFCEIMKSGAAATFIRRETGVETIVSGALPVGVNLEAESDIAVRELRDGDMLIMVSDGVADEFEDWGKLGELIEELPCRNPTDMANQILMHALAKSSKEATDDMSVLVAGIWNKN